MSEEMDMSTPVTRGELREEIALLEQKIDQKLAHFATKRELEFWGGALLARMETFEQRLGGFEQRLLAELAQHTKTISESLSAQISIIDEKYADLPTRVSRLEGEVFPSTQR